MNIGNTPGTVLLQYTGDGSAALLQFPENTFDDEKFVKMDPEARIDAAYARKEFGDKKPELVDYLLWQAKFVTKSDYVEL